MCGVWGVTVALRPNTPDKLRRRRSPKGEHEAAAPLPPFTMRGRREAPSASYRLFDGEFRVDYFEGGTAGRSELNMSTAISHFPSACLRKTSTNLPESLTGLGAPGGSIVIA